MLDSSCPRIEYCNSFLGSNLAAVRNNPSGSDSYGTLHAFYASVESRLPESLGLEGWTRTGFGSSLLIKSRASVVLPGCARPPRWGPGFLFPYAPTTYDAIPGPLEEAGHFVLSSISRAHPTLFSLISGPFPSPPYSGPQMVDHSGHLHLLRLFPFQPPVNPGPMDLARGPVIE
jgi:hypothetical protein